MVMESGVGPFYLLTFQIYLFDKYKTEHSAWYKQETKLESAINLYGEKKIRRGRQHVCDIQQPKISK